MSTPIFASSVYPPPISSIRLLSEDELASSLDTSFADWDRRSDLWLFGYDSLIWNPGLPHRREGAWPRAR